MKQITRAEWGARSPKRRTTASLAAESTAHWNGPTITVRGATTWDHSRCAGLVRGIQNFHMDARDWSDIAYNYLVCPHGYTFEGRGLNVINGANGTNSGNRSSHAICVLAGEGNPFPLAEKSGFRSTVKHIADHTVAPDRCKGHRDHKSTACPGDLRYSWVHAGMPISGTVPPPPPKGDPILKLGSKGEAVREVQIIIRNHAGGNIEVDGIFGPNTEKRVKDVQRFFNMPVDGIVGPKTWGILRFIASQPAPAPAPSPKPDHPWGAWPSREKPILKRGAVGAEVRYLQDVIAQKGGGNIAVDGIFGAQTEVRVRDVQTFFKLTVDGVVGPKTWSAIDVIAIFN